VDIAQYIDQLELAGNQLERAARYAGASAAVPSCAGWTVERLLQHVTKTHHWVTSILQGGDPHGFEFERPDIDALPAVYAAGLSGLVNALRTAREDLKVWTFFPAESPRAFWARRQAHETSIHRVDAELAADLGVMDFDPAFAADGLSELLIGLAPTRFARDEITEARTITLAPVDVNRSWTLSIGPDSVAAVEEARDGSDLTVLGPATNLYRWAWNRGADDEVSLTGDVSLADVWRRSFRVGAR
jgi:uncharacterized protein (TIGR03083 family)